MNAFMFHGGVAFAPPQRADDCSWPGSCGRTYMAVPMADAKEAFALSKTGDVVGKVSVVVAG